nr:hypothetical protein [Escherichia coli]
MLVILGLFPMIGGFFTTIPSAVPTVYKWFCARSWLIS